MIGSGSESKLVEVVIRDARAAAFLLRVHRCAAASFSTQAGSQGQAAVDSDLAELQRW